PSQTQLPVRSTLIAEHEEDVLNIQHDKRGGGRPVTRRRAVTLGLALADGALTAGSTRSSAAAVRLRQATPAASPVSDQAEAIIAIARDLMTKQDIRSIILRVTVDGQELVNAALGESMSGLA